MDHVQVVCIASEAGSSGNRSIGTPVLRITHSGILDATNACVLGSRG